MIISDIHVHVYIYISESKSVVIVLHTVGVSTSNWPRPARVDSRPRLVEGIELCLFSPSQATICDVPRPLAVAAGDREAVGVWGDDLTARGALYGLREIPLFAALHASQHVL